jgi:hypothetical protein
MNSCALVTAVALVQLVAPTDVFANSTAQRDLEHRLTEWSGHSSHDVTMKILWIARDGHEYLHCLLSNTSGHSVVLNETALPCTSFGHVDYQAFDGRGQPLIGEVSDKVVHVHIPIPPPQPLELGKGQSIERGFDFSTSPFYKLASRDNLCLVWSTTVELFAHAGKPSHARGNDIIRIRLFGITAVPKRQAQQRE